MDCFRMALPEGVLFESPLPAARLPDAAVRRALVESQHDLLGYLTRRLGSPDAAAEVLQTFAVRALKRTGDIRDVDRVRGWLSRVLASTVADHQRARARARSRETALDELGENSSAFAVLPEDDAAICNCLHKILPTLKPEYAEIVWRADLLGEPRDRIAAALGTTLNNVTVRLHRGRQALRKRLEETCRTCPDHGFLDCRCGPGT